MGLRPLNPPYEMINFTELHLTAQVEIFLAREFKKKGKVGGLFWANPAGKT
jgi:hypothetical protein